MVEFTDDRTAIVIPVEHYIKPDHSPSDYGFNDYQEDTAVTAIYPNAGTGGTSAITYVLFGLLGEAGELANKWKKHLRGDDDRDDKHLASANRDIRIADMRKELGDVLWYAARVATELDCELGQCAADNIDKLIARRNSGVLKGDGDDR